MLDIQVVDRFMSGLEAPLEKEGKHCTGIDSHLALGNTMHHCCCWVSLRELSASRCGLRELGRGMLSRMPMLVVCELALTVAL